jgi:predicted transcriptional regulator
LKEGQDFCDNCNAPSSRFLFPDSVRTEGSLIGHAQDGTEYILEPSFQSYAFYGITGSGKTSLARKVAVAAEVRGIKLLVLDPEGEWRHIIPELRQHTDYYATTKNLKINPFDLKDKQLICILLKETVLKGIQTEFWDLSPQMNYVLDMCIDRSNSIPELIDNVSYFQSDDLPFNLVGLERTKTALLVRLLPYKNNDVLKEIFYCDRSSVDLAKLDDRNIIFDLHELDAQVAYGNEVRLLYNVITIAALRQALSREVSDRIEHLLVADEAQMLVPKILQKILVTDTWASTTYSTRGRKRSQAIMFCSQSPSNLEDDIRKNVAVNFIFRLQSPDDIQVAAGLLGYTHYARVDHISRIINTLKPRQTVVKVSGNRPVLIDSVDFTLPRMGDYLLSHFMPKVGPDHTDDEQELLENIKAHPFITVVERRAMLGWDERRYTRAVDRLIAEDVIEKVRVSIGRGGQIVLYEIKKPEKGVPGVKHQFYVDWIVRKLAADGVVCRAEKVGPDIQIPASGTAINVETGTSDVRGNIVKALKDFGKVIVCSDDRKLIQTLSQENKAGNVRCSLVQDAIDLYHSMQTDAAVSIR